MQDAGDCAGSLKWNGRDATLRFIGIRKLTLCQNADEQPQDGTELTYNKLTLSTNADLGAVIDMGKYDSKINTKFKILYLE